jgi:hypothetical protein
LLKKELANNPKDWPKSLVRKSNELICITDDKEDLKCSVIPSWTKFAALPAEDIGILAP